MALSTRNGVTALKSFVKNFHPAPTSPQILKFCFTKAVCRSKHVSWCKHNHNSQSNRKQPTDFSKFVVKLTGGRNAPFCARAVKHWLKNSPKRGRPKFYILQEIIHGNLNLRSNFTLEVELDPFLCIPKMGQNLVQLTFFTSSRPLRIPVSKTQNFSPAKEKTPRNFRWVKYLIQYISTQMGTQTRNIIESSYTI